MEPRGGDSSPSDSRHPLLPSRESPDVTQMKREDPERELVGGEGFRRSQLSGSGGGGPREGVGCTISGLRGELHPPTRAALEQPEPAEPLGGDLRLTRERQAKEEAGGSQEEDTAPKMDVEGEDEEEEKLERNTLEEEAEVEQQLLEQEAGAEQSQVLLPHLPLSPTTVHPGSGIPRCESV